MEISLLSQDCIKIKGKSSSVVIDPSTLRTKTPTDAVLMLKDSEFNTPKVENFRVLIKGPGEYEFSGMRVQVVDHIYDFFVDGIKIILGRTSELERIKGEMKEHDIALLHADSSFDQSLITTIEPRIAIFYGGNAKSALKSCLGPTRAAVKPVSKFLTKKESLPEEMEMVLLG